MFHSLTFMHNGSCTTCCATNPQQIEVMEFALKRTVSAADVRHVTAWRTYNVGLHSQ